MMTAGTNTIFTKSAGLPDKTGKFSFCPAKTFSLSDKCRVKKKYSDNKDAFSPADPVLQKISVCLTAVLHM